MFIIEWKDQYGKWKPAYHGYKDGRAILDVATNIQAAKILLHKHKQDIFGYEYRVAEYHEINIIKGRIDE